MYMRIAQARTTRLTVMGARQVNTRKWRLFTREHTQQNRVCVRVPRHRPSARDPAEQFIDAITTITRALAYMNRCTNTPSGFRAIRAPHATFARHHTAHTDIRMPRRDCQTVIGSISAHKHTTKPHMLA